MFIEEVGYGRYRVERDFEWYIPAHRAEAYKAVFEDAARRNLPGSWAECEFLGAAYIKPELHPVLYSDYPDYDWSNYITLGVVARVVVPEEDLFPEEREWLAAQQSGIDDPIGYPTGYPESPSYDEPLAEYGQPDFSCPDDFTEGF